MPDKAAIFDQTRQVIARVFRVPADSVGLSTRAPDVAGWDSLAHLVLLTGLEKSFDVELPKGEALEAQDVGQLVDVIARALGAAHA